MQEEKLRLAKEKEKELKKEFTIKKGIDKVKQRMALADSLLNKRDIQEKKAVEIERVTKMRKKEMDYGKLKAIAQEGTSGFKLFG